MSKSNQRAKFRTFDGVIDMARESEEKLRDATRDVVDGSSQTHRHFAESVPPTTAVVRDGKILAYITEPVRIEG